MTASLYEKNNRWHVMLSWYMGGIRKQKSVKTGVPVKDNKTKRKAEMKQIRILNEWTNKIIEDVEEELFCEYMKRWLGNIRISIAETTYHSYKNTIDKIIYPYFKGKGIKLHELNKQHIQDFYDWRRSEGGVSGSTIRRHHANIRKALQDAVKDEIIKSNPADKVNLPKKEKFTGDFYTPDELKTLLLAVKGTRLEAPVMLAAWFGLRRGEVAGVRWESIDFDSMTLRIDGVVTNIRDGPPSEKEVFRASAKTEESIRTFPLPIEAAEYLKKVRQDQEENRKLSGDSYNEKWKGFVCIDEMGNLIHLDYISNMFAKTLKRLKLRTIRFHDLRHTNITLLLESGASMKDVQAWAGHKTISTTMDIYAHVQAKSKQRLADMMSGIIGNC